MNPVNNKQLSDYQDTFVREVRIRYRASKTRRFKIRDPQDVADYVRKILPDNSREHFVALYLDGHHQVAAYSLVATGSANMTVVHPREVFQPAIIAGATALVVAHNHPSGNTEPSKEDREATDRLREAARILGLKLLDHVIVCDSTYRSFSESGDTFL
jgi:DNA repair protein RadC